MLTKRLFDVGEFLSTYVTKKTGYIHAKEWTLALHHIHELTQNGSKTNIKAKTIKVLEESIGVNLLNIGFNDDFLDMILKTQGTKEKTDKLHFINVFKMLVHQRTLSRK